MRDALIALRDVELFECCYAIGIHDAERAYFHAVRLVRYGRELLEIQ